MDVTFYLKVGHIRIACHKAVEFTACQSKGFHCWPVLINLHMELREEDWRTMDGSLGESKTVSACIPAKPSPSSS